MKSRNVLAAAVLAVVLGGGVCLGLYARHEARAVSNAASVRERRVGAVSAAEEPREEDDDGAGPGYGFHTPSGRPSALHCADARRIVAQVRTSLVAPPAAVELGSFVESTADWLDPHALWSVAPDAPREVLRAELRRLLPDLQATKGKCRAAEASGEVVAAWVTTLRGAFDKARAAATVGDASAAEKALPAAGDALLVARELGTRVGAFEHALGPEATRYADAARDRFFPSVDAHGWGEIVLAAAVRAYVPLVDPHGAWAPYDEEASVYDVDLASNAPRPLWTRAELTAVGVALAEGAAAPFQKGDVLVSLGEMATAGLPLEQVEQLGLVASEAKAPLPATVLRAGELTSLSVGGPEPIASAKQAETSSLTAERVRWGTGDVLVVAIHDVRDDLGEDLARVLRRERGPNPSDRSLAGVVLDLRGNGGGSTDGAMHAIGLFMPGVPLFPMKRRDGTVEIEHAAEPPEDDRYRGPVATLVDAATASAAEMMAGAFTSYGRGPSVGHRTFGKGCAQEYFDDEPRTGVLRLTTLLYALPDGTPVQRVGLLPTLEVPFEGQSSGMIADREASLVHAPPTWRGPDMRAGWKARGESWPVLRDELGDCKEPDVCVALKSLSLGWPRRAPVAKKRPAR